MPTWVVTSASAGAAVLEDKGVEIIVVEESAENNAFLRIASRVFAQRGLTRILIEGGGRLAASLLNANLVDEIAWFRSGIVLGGDGRSAAAALDYDGLGRAPRFQRHFSLSFGPDTLDMLARLPAR